MIVHAGLVAKREQGRWAGVLIRGPSGSGKSDLAVRMLALGFRLVADDRVKLLVAKNRIFGCAPATLAGLLEIRGLGFLKAEPLKVAEIGLLVTCVESDEPERLPEQVKFSILGIPIPAFNVQAFEPSAPAKLCRAFEVLGSARQEDY